MVASAKHLKGDNFKKVFLSDEVVAVSRVRCSQKWANPVMPPTRIVT